MTIASDRGHGEGKAAASMRPARGVGALAARSVANLRSWWPLIDKRRKSRSLGYPVPGWATPLLLALALTAAALALDVAAAGLRGDWPPALYNAAWFTTYLGLAGWYLYPALLVLLSVNLADWHGGARRRLLILYNRTSLAIFVLVAIGAPGLVTNLIKRIVGRPRPEFFDEHGAFGFDPFTLGPHFASFPSGHATTVGSVAGILLLLFPRAWGAILAVAIWIAATRIIIGAHHPGDVVAGLAIGCLMAVGVGLLMARLGYFFRQGPNGLPKIKQSARILW